MSFNVSELTSHSPYYKYDISTELTDCNDHSIQMHSFHFHNFYKAYYLSMNVYHKVLFIYCSRVGYLLIRVPKNSLIERKFFTNSN